MANHPLCSTFSWGNARLSLSCANLFKDGFETAELNGSLCEQSSGWVATHILVASDDWCLIHVVNTLSSE